MLFTSIMVLFCHSNVESCMKVWYFLIKQFIKFPIFWSVPFSLKHKKLLKYFPLWSLVNSITHGNYCFILLCPDIINLLPKRQKIQFYLQIYQIFLFWKSASQLDFPENRCFAEQIRWMPLGFSECHNAWQLLFYSSVSWYYQFIVKEGEYQILFTNISNLSVPKIH